MGACPSPHGCIPRPGGTRLWHDAGDPSAAAAAPCERERSAAGPVRSPGWAPGAERRRREEKGEGKEGAPAVLQCSAAPSRARRPGSAPPLQQCRCEHRAAPGRTGPGIPCPTGPPPAPTAPSFGSPPLSRPRFVFLPLLPGRRDVSSRCPGDLPLAHCLPRRGGGGASSCPRRRRPGGHAGSHPRPLSSPASGRGSPRRRDCCEAPGAAPIRGGSPGSALLRSSFSWGKLPPPHVTSGPPPGAPHPRRRPSRSFAPSPLSPPRGPAANSAVCPTRDPRRGRGVPPPLPYPAAGI